MINLLTCHSRILLNPAALCSTANKDTKFLISSVEGSTVTVCLKNMGQINLRQGTLHHTTSPVECIGLP